MVAINATAAKAGTVGDVRVIDTAAVARKPVGAGPVAIGPERMEEAPVLAMLDACVKAAELVESRAVIRIDCRADASGQFKLFDLNMKPNMTGAGRPGRADQDCLSAIAARADGWSYADMLDAMLATAWK